MKFRILATAVALLLLAASADAALLHYSVSGSVSSIVPGTPTNSLAPLTIGTPMTLDWFLDPDAIPPFPPGEFSANYTPTEVVLTLGGYAYSLTGSAVTPGNSVMTVQNGSSVIQSDLLVFGSRLTHPAGDPLDPLVGVAGDFSMTLFFTDPTGTWVDSPLLPTPSFAFPSRQMSLASPAVGSLLDFATSALTVVPEPEPGILTSIPLLLAAWAGRVTRRK